MSVTYEFEAFPATFWRKDRGSKYNPSGYRFGCLSHFTFTTLGAAKRELRRLKRVTKLAGRSFGREYGKILRVERTPCR